MLYINEDNERVMVYLIDEMFANEDEKFATWKVFSTWDWELLTNRYKKYNLHTEKLVFHRKLSHLTAEFGMDITLRKL